MRLLTALEEHLHCSRSDNLLDLVPGKCAVVRCTRVVLDKVVRVDPGREVRKGEVLGEGKVVAILVKPAAEVRAVDGEYECRTPRL